MHDTFGYVGHVFPKYMIFCGSQGRAKFMKEEHPYHETVYNAYYEQFDLIMGICEMEETLLRDPGKMSKRVHIDKSKTT